MFKMAKIILDDLQEMENKRVAEELERRRKESIIGFDRHREEMEIRYGKLGKSIFEIRREKRFNSEEEQERRRVRRELEKQYREENGIEWGVRGTRTMTREDMIKEDKWIDSKLVELGYRGLFETRVLQALSFPIKKRTQDGHN